MAGPLPGRTHITSSLSSLLATLSSLMAAPLQAVLTQDLFTGLREGIWARYHASFAFLARLYVKLRQGELSLWEMVQTAVICGLLPGLWILLAKRPGTATTGHAGSVTDAGSTDPGLLKKYSQVRSYTTPLHRFTYPGVRVFYRPHPQAQKLPSKPSPLPLLVFVHGLGGSLAQFHPLLTSLVNMAPCLGIDLPGCGLSSFAPRQWEAYTTEALVELLAIVIEEHRDKESGQGVVLVGHSMGCFLAVLLASRTSPSPSKLADHVVGMIAICPKATAPSARDVPLIKKLLLIPGPIFDLWRRWDRRGGMDSKSVRRFVGKHADAETKRLQVRFNEQSKTPVWRRMVAGLLPRYSASGEMTGGFPGKEVWAGLDMPVFLIAGEEDAVTKPEEIEVIVGFMGRAPPQLKEKLPESSPSLPDAAAPVDSSRIIEAENTKTSHVTSDGVEISGYQERVPQSGADHTSAPPKRRRVLKTTILPSPAAHALLYTPASSRILAGILADFMAAHVSSRLSLGWQLQYLSTEGKWDVKNLAKWKAVVPVSGSIAGIFRAMKTLREVDETHRPEVFVGRWGGVITDVIDISHENPVYDPRGLEKGGVRYHKFPTISKVPPTPEEVTDFVELVDRILRERPGSSASTEDERKPGLKAVEEEMIGVHCHYGFNRTGFFIVCYLVERRGYKLQAAIDEFAKQRPPGIRHDHFVDTLFVRYCVGLKRAPTF
ncbi:MAG: hypothetical protein M1832_004978 [Thelocarpon impressellum]|nr:MAG: hypothetical protein M1832_004978 [Thelocarpon impressellum]